MNFINAILEFLTINLEKVNEILININQSNIPEQMGEALAYCVNSWIEVYMPLISKILEVIM